jgi:hypothetical protein
MTTTSQTPLWRNPRRLARFEIGLAAACLLVPLFLIGFDSWHVRGSISAYWDMTQHQIFYYGLTVAAMLFVVRGARSGRHWYSAGLGLALSGVILFNEEFWQPWHGIFAALFFAGGIVAIEIYSQGEWASKVRVPLLVLSVAVILAWKPLGLISLFWAEWLAMFALAAHFTVHALEEIRQETADDRPNARYEAR